MICPHARRVSSDFLGWAMIRNRLLLGRAGFIGYPFLTDRRVDVRTVRPGRWCVKPGQPARPGPDRRRSSVAPAFARQTITPGRGYGRGKVQQELEIGGCARPVAGWGCWPPRRVFNRGAWVRGAVTPRCRWGAALAPRGGRWTRVWATGAGQRLEDWVSGRSCRGDFGDVWFSNPLVANEMRHGKGPPGQRGVISADGRL